MKKQIKFLDKKHLNNTLRFVYKILIFPILVNYKLSKITSIPKEFHKNFDLKARYVFLTAPSTIYR
jgi:hypothetical protein